MSHNVSVVVRTRLTKDVFSTLRKIATKEDRTMAALIRRLVNEALAARQGER